MSESLLPRNSIEYEIDLVEIDEENNHLLGLACIFKSARVDPLAIEMKFFTRANPSKTVRWYIGRELLNDIARDTSDDTLVGDGDISGFSTISSLDGLPVVDLEMCSPEGVLHFQTDRAALLQFLDDSYDMASDEEATMIVLAQTPDYPAAL